LSLFRDEHTVLAAGRLVKTLSSIIFQHMLLLHCIVSAVISKIIFRVTFLESRLIIRQKVWHSFSNSIFKLWYWCVL